MNDNELIQKLSERFTKHMHRHPHTHFDEIKNILSSNPSMLKTVSHMEETHGEPDVALIDGVLYYVDFSKETPEGRRNLCYDETARLSRKKFPPESSAEKVAQQMGISLLDETMYQLLQNMESFDLKTSSWLKTPDPVRSLGGALFGDKRYNRTFIYHNGADSYYGVRGFRGYIKIK